MEDRPQARTRDHHVGEWRSLARHVRQRPAGRRHDVTQAGLRLPASAVAGPMTRRSVLAFGIAALATIPAVAADAAERRVVARRLADVVRREYQDPVRAEAMADAI